MQLYYLVEPHFTLTIKNLAENVSKNQSLLDHIAVREN